MTAPIIINKTLIVMIIIRLIDFNICFKKINMEYYSKHLCTDYFLTIYFSLKESNLIK